VGRIRCFRSTRQEAAPQLEMTAWWPVTEHKTTSRGPTLLAARYPSRFARVSLRACGPKRDIPPNARPALEASQQPAQGFGLPAAPWFRRPKTRP